MPNMNILVCKLKEEFTLRALRQVLTDFKYICDLYLCLQGHIDYLNSLLLGNQCVKYENLPLKCEKGVTNRKINFIKCDIGLHTKIILLI